MKKIPSRHPWLWAALAMLVCAVADAILLALLPRLGLSFGPVGPPLVLISIVRFGLLALAVLFLWVGRLLKRKTTALAALVIILQFALLAIEIDGLYIEPFRLGVTELPISSPAFLPARPLHVLQISDLHIERLSPRERAVLAKTEELQPDIIVLTGDYVNPDYRFDALAIQETRHLLSRLDAPYGVYAVNGNVENEPVMAAIFDGLANVRVLDDEAVPVSLPGGTLYLVGVTISYSRDRDLQALKALMASLPPEVYSVLLYHSPDLIKTAASSGVDLYLAGHTHGGQIRLPFYGAIITFSQYGKKYEMGKYTLGPTTLYVSRGIGMVGGALPRARFLCPPELVLAELGP